MPLISRSCQKSPHLNNASRTFFSLGLLLVAAFNSCATDAKQPANLRGYRASSKGRSLAEPDYNSTHGYTVDCKFNEEGKTQTDGLHSFDCLDGTLSFTNPSDIQRLCMWYSNCAYTDNNRGFSTEYDMVKDTMTLFTQKGDKAKCRDLTHLKARRQPECDFSTLPKEEQPRNETPISPAPSSEKEQPGNETLSSPAPSSEKEQPGNETLSSPAPSSKKEQPGNEAPLASLPSERVQKNKTIKVFNQHDGKNNSSGSNVLLEGLFAIGLVSFVGGTLCTFSFSCSKDKSTKQNLEGDKNKEEHVMPKEVEMKTLSNPDPTVARKNEDHVAPQKVE